jgi:signal peptidase I
VKTEAERTTLKRAPDAKATGERHRNPILRFLGELPGLVIIALVLAILIKTFLFQAFYIPSASMEPTLHGCTGCSGDRVLVTKIPYYFGDPKRGDIIVFEDPDPAKRPDRGVIGGFTHWLFQAVGVQKPDNEDFIKRVIGLPGDTVWAKHGKVYVNDIAIAEPYLPNGLKTGDFPQTKVPKSSYFVLGDNRSNSDDSRFGLGFIPREAIIGRAFFLVWPPSRWTTL